jgi:hypothetical protein
MPLAAARAARGRSRPAGSVCCIAGLLKSSSPDGLKRRDRILEMLDRRLQVGLLSGEQRAVRRQLLADGVEEITELAELVAGGRSSVTPNSPLPRRVKPLRST